MRENRPYGSEGGEAKSLPYPYLGWFDFNFQTAKTYFAFPRRGLLGLVQLEFFRDRSRDARPRAQPLIIGFHLRPFCQFDWRGRHGPVDDGDEIGVGDA